MIKIQPFKNIYIHKIRKASIPSSTKLCQVKEAGEFEIGVGRIISHTGADYSPNNRGINELVNEGVCPEYFFTDVKDKQILDIGCGGGQLVLDLCKRGAKAFGIDIASYPNMKKYPELFRVADATKTGFPDESFNQVQSHWSVFSMGRDDIEFQIKVMNEIKRILKRGRIRLGLVEPQKIFNISRKVAGLRLINSVPPLNEKGYGWVELMKL